MNANFWGARAPRPLFLAPRRKVRRRRCDIQNALCEADNAASEALALPNHRIRVNNQ
jgi:hypothetical protein